MVELKISERDDIADLLALIPPWFVGAVFWVAISELILKRLYPNDFIKLQAAIVGADAVGGDMPPGVAMVAIMYNTLYAVEVTEELSQAFFSGVAQTATKFFVTLTQITGFEFAGQAR